MTNQRGTIVTSPSRPSIEGHGARWPGPAGDGRLISELGRVLKGAGYTESALRTALHVPDLLAFRLGESPVYRRRLDGTGPLGTLIELFYLGLEVEEELVARSVAPITVEELSALGLVEQGTSGVMATVRLRPYDGLIVAGDRSVGRVTDMPPDYVGSVDDSSIALAALTIRRPVSMALDIGTGSGIQALLAARHSHHVIATDVNPRALSFAQFNASMNRLHNIEFRHGPGLEPVEGDTFDLIVCNPPYVVSPDAAFQYRDSALPNDTLCQQLIVHIPDSLREGGFAHLLCNWVTDPKGEWSASPTEWIAGRGCDAWLLRHSTDDALSYAANWNNPLQTDPWVYDQTLARWLDYYQRQNIRAITSGALMLRRRSGPPGNWTRAVDLPSATFGVAGDDVLHLFEAQDVLEQLCDDAALLQGTFRLSDNLTFVQGLTSQDGGFKSTAAVLRHEHGLRFQGTIDEWAAYVVSRCDGRRRLGDLVDEMIAQGHGDIEDLETGVATVVRRLVELGFLRVV